MDDFINPDNHYYKSHLIKQKDYIDSILNNNKISYLKMKSYCSGNKKDIVNDNIILFNFIFYDLFELNKKCEKCNNKNGNLFCKFSVKENMINCLEALWEHKMEPICYKDLIERFIYFYYDNPLFYFCKNCEKEYLYELNKDKDKNDNYNVNDDDYKINIQDILKEIYMDNNYSEFINKFYEI